MKSLGYEVDYFHADVKHGKLFVQDFIPFKNNCDSRLQFPAYYWDSETQKEVINLICESIPSKCSEIIIESQTLNCATWGELVAEHLNAKHIIYCLSEDPRIPNNDMFEFLNFKLDRGELAGITQNSLLYMFNGWRKIGRDESCYLTAHGASGIHVLDEIPYKKIDSIPQNDFIIGSIGRIDKLFLKESLNSIIRFAKKNKNKTFTVLLIGGASNNKSRIEIEDKLKNIDNVDLHISGLIFPIPIELVKLADVYFSSSGACRISQELGIPTIAIDGKDFKPIGVLGETTENTLHRDDEPIISFTNLLEDILIKDRFSENGNSRIGNRKPIVDYSDHLDFIEKSANSSEYFDISEATLSMNERLKKIILTIFGIELTAKIINKLISPIWMKLKRYDLVS
ncbi:hypothetical protein [Halalkalibaculum sp. DA3122]|uniref:hypothetical protein n=1 Tax=Halalkalibaculum sp. DA3122 TaxID=3373607 RepID=UPI003755386A